MFTKVKNAIKKAWRVVVGGAICGAVTVGGISVKQNGKPMPVINAPEIGDTIKVETWAPHYIDRMSLSAGDTWKIIAIRNDSIFGVKVGTMDIACDYVFKGTPNRR